ncbi:MAG: hypothetical protein PVG38_06875 [Gammaproteobacteria bacterium]
MQIRRLSPHQNGKVIALLMVVVSLPLFVLMAVTVWLAGPPVDQHGGPLAFPLFMFFILPFFYLIFAYIAVALVCVIYNLLFRVVGGFELELTDHEPWPEHETRPRPQG